MTPLSDPYVIALSVFGVVMIAGYYSAKWQGRLPDPRPNGETRRRARAASGCAERHQTRTLQLSFDASDTVPDQIAKLANDRGITSEEWVRRTVTSAIAGHRLLPASTDVRSQN